jgi:GT2 family glycosyltransferase
MSRHVPTVAVVVNHDGWAWTERCVATLRAGSVPVDVIVVDSGSRDGSASRVRAMTGTGLDAILLRANRGYAAAINAAMPRVLAGGWTFAWLLNNDVTVPQDCHARLATAAEGEEAALWTPRLLSPDGTPQHVGGVWAEDGGAAALVSAEAFASRPAGGTWLTGTALFGRVATLERIGPLDESYFAYWEDVEWSFRAREAGVKLRIATEASVTHAGSASSARHGSALSSHLVARNELRFAGSRAPAGARGPVLCRVLARQLRWARLLHGRGFETAAAGVIGGIAAGLAGAHGRPITTTAPSGIARETLQDALVTAHRLEALAASRTRSIRREGRP